MKIAGTSKGKGFQGTIKRHNFTSGPKSHGSHNMRAPGSIGASATPSRVFQGHSRSGSDGQQARHPEGPRDRRRRRRPRTCCSSAARCPGPAAGSWRCVAMPDAPLLGAQRRQEGQTRRRRLRRSLPRSARAPERSRRAGRAPSRHRGHQNPRQRLRRRREAVASEGHRSRACWLQPLARLDRRWNRVRPPASLIHLQGQPQGAARGAAQRALPARRPRVDRDPRRLRLQGARRRARRSTCSRTGTHAEPRPTLVVLVAEEGDAALSFRNLARVAVLTPRTSASPICSAPLPCWSPKRPSRR